MTAENPNDIDTREWLARAHRRLQGPARPRDWKVDDLKLALMLRDKFTRAELLALLDIASGARFDARKGIEDFLRIMAAHIDGMEDA
jgi:hypothetical protein